MSGPASPRLPPWPTPRWETITDPKVLERWVQDAMSDPVVAVVVSPAPTLTRNPVAPQLAMARADSDAPVVLVDLSRLPVRALDPLLRDEGPYWVSYDGQLALRQLAPLGIYPPRLGSIHSAAVLLSEGTKREHQLSLEHCVEQVLGHSLATGAGLGGDEPQRAIAVSTLIPLMRTLTPLLRQRGLARVYDLECHLLPAVVDMERVGVMLDGAHYQRIVDGWVRERRTCTEPAAMTRLDKLISTYGHWARDFVDVDGRIRCSLHPLAADSGRFSCTQPNLQQVPGEQVAPGLRSCFVAAPEHRLVIADYSQLELRVAAHLAPCAALRAVFHDGRDPHRATAASITGKAEGDVTAAERQLAKAVNFGFLFGMGVARFREYARTGYGVDLSTREATLAREAFFATFPGLLDWHRRTADLEHRRRDKPVVVRTAMGRRKRFPAGRFSFTAALNIPVQGTAAEGFKLAMIELHRALAAMQARGILCIHDEYVAEVPTERAEEARDLIEATMRRAMGSLVPSVPIEVHSEIGLAWS